MIYIDMNKCDICGTCVSVCPKDAITVEEFRVFIDANRCISCLLCTQICPLQAIGENDDEK